MASLNAALKFLSLPNACPLCVVALDPQTGHPISANSTFESTMGPLYKFRGWDFANAASEKVSRADASAAPDANEEESNRSKFRSAIDTVRTSLCGDGDTGETKGEATARVRNVEMLTLGTNDAGLPVRRYFDWTVGSVQLDGDHSENGQNGNSESSPSSVVIMYGDMVNEVESSNRARDAELVDFFQNAPIAMHWLNGDGTVLWANHTELNVLGYTAEEYIGQPIMKFCPDEKELVLEIFKQLGSGNAIADVPVRFRTKDGKLVHLLIDSNVAYNPDGSFGHTRCFIRDDTARKIKDARSKLLLEETERSLRMLDGFLSRTLHHVMGPLHALRGTCEIVRDSLKNEQSSGMGNNNKRRARHDCLEEDMDEEKNVDLLDRAAETVMRTTRMVADVSDLARFDEGARLRTKWGAANLREVGVEAIEALRFANLRLKGGDDGISVSLKLLGGGGPGVIQTDRAALLRVLAHLLENAVREVDSGGNVTLRITSARGSDGSDGGGVIFEVVDDGKGLPPGTCLDQGSAAAGGTHNVKQAPSHRYTNTNGKMSNDPDEIKKVRTEMEERAQCLQQNGVGVGLPLCYHLVRALGGDLRHDPSVGQGTRIWFILQTKHGNKSEEVNGGDVGILKTETILKNDCLPTTISFEISKEEASPEQARKRRRTGDAEFAEFSPDDSASASGDDTSTVASDPLPPPQAVAKCGVKASMPFSVLIVEDTDICARILGMQLKKMKCSFQRAENGRIAVDMLKDAMPGTFDMVLMDLRMPVMDGLEATKLIREELKMKDLPILALTGEMRGGIRSECEAIGFDGFFQKPLPKVKLQELVTKFKAARDGEAG